MRIQEIIIESTELEEGWKSKVGAAALAGAAALGGGGDAQAQNYQPTAQSTQQNQINQKKQQFDELMKSQPDLKKYLSMDDLGNIVNRMDLSYLTNILSGIIPAVNQKLLTPEQGALFNKFMDIHNRAQALLTYPRTADFKQRAVTAETIRASLQDLQKQDSDLNFYGALDPTNNKPSMQRATPSNTNPSTWLKFGDSSDIEIYRNAAMLSAYAKAGLLNQNQVDLLDDSLNLIKNYNNALSAVNPSYIKTARDRAQTAYKSAQEDAVDMKQAKQKNDQKFINGFSEHLNKITDTLTTFVNQNKSGSDARSSEPESNNAAKSASSVKNDDNNVRGGATGAAQYDQDLKLATKLSDYVKSFKEAFPNIQDAVKTLDNNAGLEKLQRAFDYFQKNQNTIKTMEVESDYDDYLKELGSIIKDYKSYLNKSDYKQDQSPSSSQSPKSPEVKQTDSKVGFEAKTTGKGTGLTKNGDKYTGEWKDGFADGKGERTLVNKGYTGGMVKTGNKLDTQWKNGMPVNGASVKVTTPDGKVFNGHIKRGDENPWGYMIVK